MKFDRAIERLGLRESDSRYNRAAQAIDDATGPRLLEIGPAGTKGILRKISCADVVFVDIQEEFAHDTQAQKVRADVTELPFTDGSFPYVVALDVLEHLPQRKRGPAMRSMYRVTQPGGKLLVSSPVGEAAHEADLWLAAALERTGVSPHRWVEEHNKFGLPSHEDYEEWFQSMDPAPSIGVEGDASVESWKRALEFVAVPANKLSRLISLSRFALVKSHGPDPADPMYRYFYTIEKPEYGEQLITQLPLAEPVHSFVGSVAVSKFSQLPPAS